MPETVFDRQIPLVKHPEGWEDDAAYLILGYPRATAVVSGSWAWPHPRGEIVCFGSKGSLITRFGEPPTWESHLLWRNAPEKVGIEQIQTLIPPPEIPPERKNGMAPFAHCIRNDLDIDSMHSAATSLMVQQVLEAAQSARSPKKRIVAVAEIG